MRFFYKSKNQQLAIFYLNLNLLIPSHWDVFSGFIGVADLILDILTFTWFWWSVHLVMSTIEEIKKVWIEAGAYGKIGLNSINRWILYNSWYNDIIVVYDFLWIYLFILNGNRTFSSFMNRLYVFDYSFSYRISGIFKNLLRVWNLVKLFRSHLQAVSRRLLH